MQLSNNKPWVIGAICVLVGIILISRLFYVQVIDTSYRLTADNNARRLMVQYPARGVIWDRNNRLLVANQPVYDVMIIPREVRAFDSIDFCTSLGITKNGLNNLFAELKGNLRARKTSTVKPSVFLKQISSQQYAVFQEKLFKFKGFYVQQRVLRTYEYENAAHVLGYIGEVNDKMIEHDPYYASGDYKGISGIEESYEAVLRGKKGCKYVMVDVHGREKGSFMNGLYDTASVSGKNLTLSLDIELQKYGELLMQNKTGAVVAIEPSTGEILAMISGPTYNPNLMVGRERIKNYPILNNDPLKPLLFRPIMGEYPPGSTFKCVNALIAQNEGVIDRETRFGCSMGYHVGGLTVGCHRHASPLNLPLSIANSCNAYYCNVFRKIVDQGKYHSVKKGLDVWKDYLVKFGFGYKLGVDLSSEKRGLIPNSKFYDKIYNGSWNSVTCISISIGQGEVLATPLQIANCCAIIANRGYFYTPHVVKKVEDGSIADLYFQKRDAGVQSIYYDALVEGMEQAVLAGTARVAQIKGIEVCGKTGTAQNPHGEDHSEFMAFAPKNNPRIAIAVVVENGGFGATWAAPIASLMMEKYLKDTIDVSRKPLEERIINGDLIHPKTTVE